MTINNNIQESYCSFEVSKLLKEKGFIISEESKRHFYGDNAANDSSLLDGKTSSGTYSPTHALAIEWIKQNFSSDKIKHITYDYTSEELDIELKVILKTL